VAVASLTEGDPSDDPADRALAAWARRVADDPNRTTAADVQQLRDAGFDDHQVFAITLFVGLRLAFSTVNAALGATPDPEVLEAAPPEVREAVTWGRPVASA
jgi:alkylhydroperoxidase family enzyme